MKYDRRHQRPTATRPAKTVEDRLERMRLGEAKRHYLEWGRRYFDRIKSKYSVTLDESAPLEAVAQHYGLPTMLLDFSFDPDVAVFFASQQRKCEQPAGVVYGIAPHTEPLGETSLRILAWPVELSRIAAQRGAFLEVPDQPGYLDLEGFNLFLVRFPIAGPCAEFTIHRWNPKAGRAIADDVVNVPAVDLPSRLASWFADGRSNLCPLLHPIPGHPLQDAMTLDPHDVDYFAESVFATLLSLSLEAWSVRTKEGMIGVPEVLVRSLVRSNPWTRELYRIGLEESQRIHADDGTELSRMRNAMTRAFTVEFDRL